MGTKNGKTGGNFSPKMGTLKCKLSPKRGIFYSNSDKLNTHTKTNQSEMGLQTERGKLVEGFEGLIDTYTKRGSRSTGPGQPSQDVSQSSRRSHSNHWKPEED